jgi:quercetin dioxygenase-like cupin family protein
MMCAMTFTASRVSCLAAMLFAAVPSIVGGQDPTQPPANKPIVDANHKRMQPEESDPTRSVLVFGDPNKPGMYIIRNHFAPGRTSRPHFHDQDRWVTVIKGTWWTGEGDVYDMATAVPIKTGGLMYHPAGYHHYDGAKDEDVIVQIMGMGPVKTTDTEKK